MTRGVSRPHRAHGERSPQAEGVRRVLANALALLLAYALPRLFTVGAVVLAARVLGTADFGAYGTAAAFAVIMSIIATLGMTPLLVREMARARERAPSLMRAAHIVKTASNAAMLLALLGTGYAVLRYPPSVLAAAALLGIAGAIGAYVDNFAAYVQSIEKMHFWMQASAVYGLVTGTLGALLVVTTRDMVWFSAAPIAGQAAALAWLVTRLPAPVRLGAAASRGDVLRLLGTLAPFTAAFVALTLHSKADVLLLAHLRSASDVGLYTAGYKFIDLTQALAVVAAAAAYPRLCRIAPAGTGAGRWAGTRLIELALLAAVPAGGALLLGRSTVVGLLFGDAYAASIPVVSVLAMAIPMLVINIVGGYILGAAGQMHRVAALYAFSVAVKLGLNVWLIPAHGPSGAALAMLATEYALGIAMLVVLHRHVAAAPAARAWIAVSASAGIAAAMTRLPPPSVDALTATFFLVGVAMVYALAGVVPAVERATLIEALRARRDGAEAAG